MGTLQDKLALFAKRFKKPAAQPALVMSAQTSSDFLPYADDAAEVFGNIFEPFIRNFVLISVHLNTRDNCASITTNSAQLQQTLIAFFTSSCPASNITLNTENNQIRINAQSSNDLRSLTRLSADEHQKTIKGLYLQKLFAALNRLCADRDDELATYLFSQGLKDIIHIDSLLNDNKLIPVDNKLTQVIKNIFKERDERFARIEAQRRQREEQREYFIELNKTLPSFLNKFIETKLLAISQITKDNDGVIVNSYLNPLLITALGKLLHNNKITFTKLDGNNIKIMATRDNIAAIKKITLDLYLEFIEATFKDFLLKSLNTAPDELKPEIEKLLEQYQTTKLTKQQFGINQFEKNKFDLTRCLEQFNYLCRTDTMAWAVRNEFSSTLKRQLQLRLNPNARASRVKTGFFGGLVYHEPNEDAAAADCSQAKRLSITRD